MPPFQDVAEQAMLATQHSPIRARPMAERGWSQNRGRIMSHRSPALYGEVAEEPAMGMFDQQTKRDYRRSRSLNAPDTVRAGHLRSPSLGNGGGRLTGIWIPTLPGDDSEEEDIEQSSSPIPTEEPGWSAEEIATRRFMTATTTGGGMTVLKHNRGRGRVKRVLKYNTEKRLFTWNGTLPPYAKTTIPAQMLHSATRIGNLVTLSIKNQADVGFECSRLTDAIVLTTGLNGIIRAAKV